MSPAFAAAAASARMAMTAAGARAGGFGMRRRRSAHESSDVLGPAGGAFRNVGTADQRLKDRAALFAFIFVNRHCRTTFKDDFIRRVWTGRPSTEVETSLNNRDRLYAFIRETKPAFAELIQPRFPDGNRVNNGFLPQRQVQ